VRTASRASGNPQERVLLTAALGFARLGPRPAAVGALHAWLDTWRGVRAIATSMRAAHHALSLERGPDGWTATFRYTGPTPLPPAAPSAIATTATPWHAVQFAAWQVLRRDL
jgi:hypothetical protein